MKIEIPIRWAEPITDPEALEEQKTKRIIWGEDTENPEIPFKFTYDSMVCDTDDIMSFHRYDEQHFIMKMDGGEAYCVRIPYDTFKELYMELTHSLITEIRNINIIPEDDTLTEN